MESTLIIDTEAGHSKQNPTHIKREAMIEPNSVGRALIPTKHKNWMNIPRQARYVTGMFNELTSQGYTSNWRVQQIIEEITTTILLLSEYGFLYEKWLSGALNLSLRKKP